MRLKKLKLSGFKSFVDPTVVLFPSYRVGVVGPNGCGKSNIIDAVRWVMGESSAKTLRGESMSDVIFNGSTSRKPVGQASVELIFDNTEGRLTGEHAQYTEISIRRVVARDGQSTYYLNGTRCRRKDVADVFLGTGLGARSYAIIGQNTISHIIEAKPEELRLYIEEAAGISKYKDRRKDAQTRMENTRENLCRVNDVREELKKQVARLERQAAAAAQYSELTAKAKQLQAECDGIRWREWHQQFEKQEKQIHALQTQFETGLTQLKTLDTETVEIKAAYQQASDHYNQQQTVYYNLGIESARLKEAIAHQQAQHEQFMRDLEQTKTELSLAHERLEKDESHFQLLSETIATTEPRLLELETAKKTSETALMQSETDKQMWQKDWDKFNQTAAESSQKIKVSQTRIEHAEEAIHATQKRLNRLEEELAELEKNSPMEEELLAWQTEETAFKEELETLKMTLEECVRTWAFHREHNEEKRREADLLKKQLQQMQGELATLEALQGTALGKKDETVKQWLTQQSFARQPRLAQILEVEAGWEKAVERVLGSLLQGICIQHFESLGDLDTLTQGLNKGECALIDIEWKTPPASFGSRSFSSLLEKIQHANDTVKILLKNIYTAENLEEAKALQIDLNENESIITRDGAWLGKGWLQWIAGKQSHDGILQREKAIKKAIKNIEQQEKNWNELHMAYEEGCATVAEYELKRSELTEQIQMINQKWVNCGAQIRVKKNQLEQFQQRQTQLQKNTAEQITQLKQLQEQHQQMIKEWQFSSEIIQQHEKQREQWIQVREKLNQQAAQFRTQAQQDRENWHILEVKLTSLKTQQTALQHNMAREKEQVILLENRYEQGMLSLEKSQLPEKDLQPQWENISQKHAAEEATLKEANKALETLNERLKITEKTRSDLEMNLREMQTTLEKQRLNAQTLKVKCEGIQETLINLGITLSTLLENLPENAVIEQWDKALQVIHHKIKQLGPINLAALDEFKTESERKQLLDEQYEDLVKALDILEEAIRQIDNETRTRFQETYERVNTEFQTLFPRLFGGGRAYMELTSGDCLEAGITIMAQPPGKRNSSIYLLSGGEKAMTAVALIFSIFQLNPSPFCMLDEVDAPLDDANVNRFCAMVKEMSEQVQFIFITHNKITMELATHLSGVTMHEPGVSRMVTVDIEEAVSLAQT